MSIINRMERTKTKSRYKERPKCEKNQRCLDADAKSKSISLAKATFFITS